MTSDEIKIMTSCEKCIFAVHELGIQIGCKFDRIQSYRARNKLEELTPDRPYFIINTLCNACRDEAWGEKYVSAMEQVIKEIEPKIHAFVVDKSEDSGEVVKNRIIHTVDSMKNSKIKPETVHLIIQNKNLTTECIEILNNVKEQFDKNAKLTITYNLERELDMVDSAISLVEQPYYMVVKSGESLQADYISKFNTAINSEMKPVVMTDKVYLTGLHRSLGGNKIETYKNTDGEVITLSSLKDKIMILVDEQKNPGAVLYF